MTKTTFNTLKHQEVVLAFMYESSYIHQNLHGLQYTVTLMRRRMSNKPKCVCGGDLSVFGLKVTNQ